VNVTLIGAGVLGTALGILLQRAGYRIVAISSRTVRSAEAARALIGSGEVVGDARLAVMGADIVLLAVPDRFIPNLSIQVAGGGALKRGAVVAHLAGGLPSRILAGVSAAGGFRGSAHPLQTFADVDVALHSLPDSFFFLEGDPEAVDVLRSMVLALNCRPVELEGSQKALYHAGAAAASNFVVALVEYARELLVRAGVPPDVALPALLPLVRGTLANLERVGLPDALTGPIARGDLGTVRNHIRSLQALPGDVIRVYRELGRQTVQVALRKGTLSKERARVIVDALAEGEYPLPPGTGGIGPGSLPEAPFAP
jgi:predicted short-subunit dehydrogenase-like oxidoreductase (DUF2520 family)